MNLFLGLYLIGVGTTYSLVYGADERWSQFILCAFWPLAIIGSIVLDFWELVKEMHQVGAK